MKGVYWVLLSAVVVLTGCMQEESGEAPLALVRPAKIVLASPAGENPHRVFPGTVEAAVKSDLAFRVGGQLEVLAAMPGKRFAKGELLARLDDSAYVNALQDREAKYELAKSQYDKIAKLRDKNHVSPSDVDTAEANLKAAQAALSVAKDNLEYTRLLAPFDGVVANLATENHQVVNPNQTVLQLRVDNQLDVRFSVPESLLGKLKRISDPSSICAKVTFNAYPEKKYTACFKEYESAPDRLTRTYSVVHSLPTIDDISALPGMAVSVALDLIDLLRNGDTQGVLVPLSSVFERDGKTYVWRVQESGEVNLREVRVEEIRSAQLLIGNGLSAGEPIVAVGVSYLKEGMKVRPMKKERGL